MMQGITSLPGAQQAPGQAAPVSALPPQQPMTPQGMTVQLEKLPPQQLLQMFANPADKTPKWAVVTAYAKAIEQQRLMEAASGQQAMQQGQMQAQQPPVAAQVMMQPIMARHGGIMHGYAGGGAVAFQSGGNPEVERILKKSPYERTAEENEILRASGVELTRKNLPDGGISAINRMLESPFLRKMFTGEAYKLSPEELAKRQDVGAITENIVRSLGGSQVVEPTVEPTVEPQTKASEEARMAALMAPASGAWAGRTAGLPDERLKDMRNVPPPPSGSPRAGTAGSTVPAAVASGLKSLSGDLTPEELAAIAQRRKAIEMGKTEPEDVLTGRAGLAALAQKQLSEQESERQAFMRESREALEAARQRREASPLSDIAFLGQMLEGMRGSKRFGEALAGAAGGAGRAMTSREAALREAEKDFRAAQRDERLMKSNERQARMLEEQRLQAIREGKMAQVQKIEEQLAVLSMEQESLRRSKAEKAADFGLRQRDVESKIMEAQAKRESVGVGAEANRLARISQQRNIAEASRIEALRKAEKDHLEAYGQIYTMARLGVKMTPEQQAQYNNAQAELKDKLNKIDRRFMPVLNQLNSQLGMAPSADLVFDEKGNLVSQGQ